MGKEDYNSIKEAVRLKMNAHCSGAGLENVILEKERRGTEAYNKSQIRLNFKDHSFKHRQLSDIINCLW